MKDLTKGKPLKLIIMFAIPLFIGQVFQLLYSLVDTRIVGETLGAQALAGVGATSTLSDFLVGILNGLTNGFAIVIATYFGAKDTAGLKKALATTYVLGIGIAAVISIGSLLFLDPILRFLNVSADIHADAKAYISVILAGLVAATLYNILAAVLRAVGDSFTPLLFLVLSTVLNVGLDYLFILYFHTGVMGAAIATVLSQLFSSALCFIYMRKKYPHLMLAATDFHIDKDICKKMLVTGSSMAFMLSFVQLGTLALQTSINSFGSQIIVAHASARKAITIFILPCSCLGTTLATYCGQNLGAGTYSRIKQGIRAAMLLMAGWYFIVILLANTISPFLIRSITASTDPVIIDTAVLYLRVDTSVYFLPFIISLFRNSMQGFGDSKTPVISSSLELLIKLIVAYGFAPRYGYFAIILAEPISWAIMVIPLIVGMMRNPLLKMKDETYNEITS